MRNTACRVFLGLAASTLLAANASALSYTQDFEGMIPNEGPAVPNTLSSDNWLVGANVFDSGGGFVYNYFAFEAPNGGPAFSGVATGEGGAAQGANQLSVYSDYNNGNHFDGSGFVIEGLVFRDIGLLDASDVGETYDFSFDTKQGNIGGATEAFAYMNVVKTSDGSFATLANEQAVTGLNIDWDTLTISLTIDAAWVGETLQIGFGTRASGGDDSGVFYDNVNLGVSAVPVPAAVWLLGSGLLGLLGMRRKNG